MQGFDYRKYRPFPPVSMPDRRWPNQVIQQAPLWCAVDLRDGNQALIEPMSVEEKIRVFELLVKIGFKEIEIGFPAASRPDYEFARKLIEEDRIPGDVKIQVLTQARPEIIAKTFEALRGVGQAVVHLYNSTSRVQRERVFGMSRQEIIDLAITGARHVREHALAHPETDWYFQYSPESFSATELDFAVDICEAVLDVWQPTPEHKAIINLPATVEMATPNVFADQVEWFQQHLSRRDSVWISVHTHNDRGCAVAAAELALMAGADRVEGTLLGNGERTGNTDLVTLAMNLYSQGVDPRLDFSEMDEMLRTLETCTRLPVHPRHPYVGELVYTAFSGSHQDAIRKCLARRAPDEPWDVAYLPIDPRDLDRSYQAVIRINSQSGKGGVSYVLERDHGLNLPRWLQIEFSGVVQQAAEAYSREVGAQMIWELFQENYVADPGPYYLENYHIERDGPEQVRAQLRSPEGVIELAGGGQGAVEALVAALEERFGLTLEVTAYHEHALSSGTEAEAAAYIQLKCNGVKLASVDFHRDTVSAALNAVIKAMNRYLRQAARQAA